MITSAKRNGLTPQEVAKYERLILLEDQKAYRQLMKSKEGRWLLVRLEEISCLQKKIFTGNSETFYAEGRRSVAIDLTDAIKNTGLEMERLIHQGRLEKLEIEENLARLAKKGNEEDE